MKSSTEIELRDFGPIARAEFDLRPLTVFIGPSNTGKSYLSVLIYALHQFFSRVPRQDRWFASLRQSTLPGLSSGRFTDEMIDALSDVAEQIVDKKKSSTKKDIILPSALTKLIDSRVRKQNPQLSREILRCFGVGDPRDLVRKVNGAQTRLVFRKPSSDGSGDIRNELTIQARGIKFRAARPKGELIRISGGHHRIVEPFYESAKTFLMSAGEDIEDRERYILYFARSLINIALREMFAPFNPPAFYLPADRSGALHAFDVIVSALIKNAAITESASPIQVPMLSGVLADFLEHMVAFDRTRLRYSSPSKGKMRHNYGRKMEAEILGGSVHVDRSGPTGHPRIKYRPKGWKEDLPLIRVSSMVTEIAPVVLYLRHLVRPGNVLIIEEPESHMHPELQVKFIRQLAGLVSSGIRVVITTHSEWVLEKLANIVHKSELSSSDVGTWLFEPKQHPKGSVIKEIPLDKDSGLFPSGFDDVAIKLHNEWAELSN